MHWNQIETFSIAFSWELIGEALHRGGHRAETLSAHCSVQNASCLLQEPAEMNTLGGKKSQIYTNLSYLIVETQAQAQAKRALL